MTIKLKCPYSEEELEKIRNNFTNTSVVCPFCGGPVDYKNELSIALMQTQHNLEIATKALEDIKSDYELYSEQGCRMEPNETDMYNYAHTALKQIDHFADVSKMIEHKE